MSSKSELARATALALLPLGAFLFGPVFDEMAAPESIPSDVLNSVLPTVLPLAALVVVAVVSYHRTGSAARALRITSFAFAVAASAPSPTSSTSGRKHPAPRPLAA